MATVADHAVVLGASMSGLLAARVLSDFYRTVTVVERDVLPEEPVNRRGIPQGRHVHALLGRGGQIIDEFFPGFLRELVDDGAVTLDDGDFSKIYISFGGHVLVRSGFAQRTEAPMYLSSRPFLEYHVRRRLRAISNVTILDGHDVVDLIPTSDRTRVAGVQVASRAGDSERRLTGDLIVDVMGRGSRTPAFLEGIGYERPAEDHVVMRTTYASQLMRIPPADVERMVVIGAAPGRPRGMFLSSYENDQWMFTVWGMLGNEPPAELAGMLDFASDYAPPHVLAAARAGEPLGEVVRHRMPSSQWRRYDKLRRFPDGLLVCGDAICSFNPVYGQGMTVGALDALALRDCLRSGGQDLARRYFRKAAKSIAVAWQMAAGNDLAFPEVEGRRSMSTRVANRCTDWVLGICSYDTVVAEKFFRVNNFLDSPVRLLHPAFIFRLATASRRRRRRDELLPVAGQKVA
ncbi:2-polyprenyl-6-methoxyphenol hydroxylase-like oxidoreductase [Mycolicibacterium sphagni]|uniref:2-polyprenyl-6-methoxyphenol hydroxylase-like oxidoreductase n=2 Tax=Mycolicibacterium sphagni TaxID=1786 RepID=A0ABX2JWJ5_9MYCO|nr:2-polyprenyl-6-methoxyphenol hydroxylase-like oxidoreductase [Mycolicibacterium sphagni]